MKLNKKMCTSYNLDIELMIISLPYSISAFFRFF